MSEKGIIEKDIKFLQAMIKADQEAGEETSQAWINELKKLKGKLNPTPPTAQEGVSREEVLTAGELNQFAFDFVKYFTMVTGHPMEARRIAEAFKQGYKKALSLPTTTSKAEGEVSKEDMTAKEYFTGEGSPLTLDNICTPVERDFLLEQIELYAKGKVRCAAKLLRKI